MHLHTPHLMTEALMAAPLKNTSFVNRLPERVESRVPSTLDTALPSILKEAGNYLSKDARVNSHRRMKDGRTVTFESAGNGQLDLTLVGLETKQGRLQVVTHLTKSLQGKITWHVEKTWLQVPTKPPAQKHLLFKNSSLAHPLL